MCTMNKLHGKFTLRVLARIAHIVSCKFHGFTVSDKLKNITRQNFEISVFNVKK